MKKVGIWVLKGWDSGAKRLGFGCLKVGIRMLEGWDLEAKRLGSGS